ncbi:MAG: hypothetical protein EOM08_12615 [Clostridia bacterium]|nr:hypothetical protein [Clostridia bacterium]
MMVQIARIRVKMGAVDAAFSQLGECHRSIVLDLETLTREMNEDMRTGQLSDEERGRMLSDSRKLRSMLDECRALKESIQQGKAAEDRQRAEELIRRHAKASPAELRNLLEEAGIPGPLIRELVTPRVRVLLMLAHEQGLVGLDTCDGGLWRILEQHRLTLPFSRAPRLVTVVGIT